VWDHKGPVRRRDNIVDAPLVGYEAGQGFDSSCPEAGEFFISLGHELPLVLNRLLRLSQLLGELGSMAVDGGDKAIGCGVDGGAEVIVFEEEIFCFLSG